MLGITSPSDTADEEKGQTFRPEQTTYDLTPEEKLIQSELFFRESEPGMEELCC